MNNYVEMENISKSFSGNIVLEDVQFGLVEGEVHGLIGENGAGKSTLMNILSGQLAPDNGTIKINGKLVTFRSIVDGLNHGISFIHQELSMVPNLSILQNFFLGIECTNGIILDKKYMYKKTKDSLENLGLNLDPNTLVGELSVAEQQLVEISKAISFDSKIIIMDEPTTSLTDNETKQLFDQIKILTQKGISIIFISHKLDELLTISDRITVLRDGKYIDTVDSLKIDEDQLIHMMVGRELTSLYIDNNRTPYEEIVLKASNLSNAYIKNINFNVHKGEILGISGLVGAGRSELAYSLYGLYPFSKGNININNKDVVIKSPEDALKNGMAFVTEDRKETGLFLDQTIQFNVLLPIYNTLINNFRRNINKENEIVDDAQKKLKIKMANRNQICGNLSGGNQQKVLLARWLETNPDILILDEPTKGIDIGARSEIYAIISELAKQGMSIIMISSDMNEILNLSDRVLVMHNGKINAVIDSMSEEFNQNQIMYYATGGVQDEQRKAV